MNNSIPIKIDRKLIVLALILTFVSSLSALHEAKFFIAIALSAFAFNRNIAFNLYFWLFIFLSTCTQFITNGQYRMANFHYALIYFQGLIICTLWFGEEREEDILQKSARLLFLVIMGMATIQKFFSPQYFYGDFFYRLLLEEHITKWPLSWIIKDAKLIQIDNQQIYQSMINGFNLNTLSTTINPGPDFLKSMATILTWGVLVFEALLTYLYLFFNRHKLTHYLSILFLLGTLYMRPQETLFLALLSLICFAQCPRESRSLRICYITLIVVLIALGFNKSILRT